MVAYFAAPPDIRAAPELNTPRSHSSVNEFEKFKRLFLSFINIPCDEKERRMAWGLPPERPNPNGQLYEGDSPSDADSGGDDSPVNGGNKSKGEQK